jgi:hypothetical protein
MSSYAAGWHEATGSGIVGVIPGAWIHPHPAEGRNEP